MSDWNPLFTVLTSILVTLVTAWITVELALRRFKSEKWFERRLDAYTRIIESLHHMKSATARQIRAEERGIEIPSNAEAELIELYGKGLADLRRLTDMGALVFSSEAIVVLEKLNEDLKAATQEVSWWGHLDMEFEAINKCLKEIGVIAKRDLNA